MPAELAIIVDPEGRHRSAAGHHRAAREADLGIELRPPSRCRCGSPWSWAFEPASTRLPFEYRGAVARAFLENPVAQRAVRLVAEGVGSAPLLPSDEAALALVGATSAGQSLLETLAAQLLLHGNGYVQVVRAQSSNGGAGAPVELFALRPERVATDRLDINAASFAAGEAPSVPLVEVREAA